MRARELPAASTITGSSIATRMSFTSVAASPFSRNRL
jgi:hypothetical protein